MHRRLRSRGPRHGAPVTPLRRLCGAWDTVEPGIGPRVVITIYEDYIEAVMAWQ